MILTDYYHIIKQKIESDEFTFKGRDKSFLPTRDECKKNSHLESINYLMFEFMSDRKDPRKKDIFDYVCVPKGVNTGDMDIDFTTWEVEEFLKQIMKLKD